MLLVTTFQASYTLSHLIGQYVEALTYLFNKILSDQADCLRVSFNSKIKMEEKCELSLSLTFIGVSQKEDQWKYQLGKSTIYFEGSKRIKRNSHFNF